MTAADVRAPEPHDPELVDGLRGVLAPFNQAGVLSAADVHGALRLGRLAACSDELPVLGAAFAIRAPRFGHVFARLADLPSTVTDEDGRTVPLDPGVWPDLDEWITALAASTLVTSTPAPLHLDGGRLYLDRYWRHEHRVADALARRAAGGQAGADKPSAAGSAGPLELSADGRAALTALFVGNARQAQAARAALETRLAVIAGGPGTGKTATVARLVGLVGAHGRVRDGIGQAVLGGAGRRAPRVAVAAPTGKAAARLGEALRESMAADLGAGLMDVASAEVVPQTLHRLLGGSWGGTRFRHDAGNPLPYDLVVLDEVSMVPLALLGRLLEALDDDASLVLVGDPDQLASVEAGTVLGDIIDAADSPSLAGQVVTLTHNYRNDEGITRFAQQLRAGDVEGALEMLVRDPAEPTAQAVSLVTPDRPGQWPTGAGSLTGVRKLLEQSAKLAIGQALAGDHVAALATTMSAKVLCAHRKGPDGVGAWNSAVEGWVLDVPWYHRPEWYAGRPVMASRNDYDLDVYNGDIGVVVRQGDSLRVVVDGRDGEAVEHRRLGSVSTVHAMTVHKSQGSQFDDVVVVLPHEASPIMSRELLYTAVTRARNSVTIVGTEASLRRAVERRVTRASALSERLRDRLTD